jgi:four helix bundle protein
MSQELEERFTKFAEDVRDFCRLLKWDIINTQYIKQVVRSSSSVAANYIEASDDLGKLDEKMKLKIARREAKETVYWLRLVLLYDNKDLQEKRLGLMDEGTQIKKIISSILGKL